MSVTDQTKPQAVYTKNRSGLTGSGGDGFIPQNSPQTPPMTTASPPVTQPMGGISSFQSTQTQPIMPSMQAPPTAPTMPPVPQAGGDTPNDSPPPKSKNNTSKLILGGLALLMMVVVGGAGILVSQKQRVEPVPVAPTAPQSKPLADIVKEATCTLTFDVGEPSYICDSVCDPEATEDVCTAVDPDWSCLEVEVTLDTDPPTTTQDFRCRLTEAPDSPTCSTEPTPTPTPSLLVCGVVGCEEDTDCGEDLVCQTVTIDEEEVGICAEPDLEEACGDDPSAEACCSEPTPTPTPGPSATPTPGPSATPTPPPGSSPTPTPRVVITTTNCNDACTANKDCSNASHICYNGKCRLDSNPENEQCLTPSGETTTVILPAQLPVSGPEDWINYLKAGLGALGVGVLLLLFL